MDKVKCANPNCGKLFSPDGMGKNQSRYCSGKCRDTARFLRAGQIAAKDDFNELRGGSIILSNNVEIRNDAMGKEIAERSQHSYYVK